MASFKRIPLALLCLVTIPLFSASCAKKEPVASVAPENFRLPAHFERRIAANEEAVVPVGHAVLLEFKTHFKNKNKLMDIRSLETALKLDELPSDVNYRIMQQSSSLLLTTSGIEAVNVIRLDIISLSAGASFKISGTIDLRESHQPDNIIESSHFSKKIDIVAYDPDMEMVKADRDAALFYIENSLSHYDRLTKKGQTVAWEPTEIEAQLDEADSFEASGLLQLWKARRRAEEGRRHLHAATESSNQEVANYARNAIAEIDKSFNYWKDNGVKEQKKEKKVDQLFAEDKMERRYAKTNLDTDEHFQADINLPTIARPWLTPISMGLALENRFGAVGPASRRSTVIVETLSGQLAIHPNFWVGVRLPFSAVRSQSDGSKWADALLNPAITLGTGYVERKHWRVRFEAEYMPNIGLKNDLSILEYFLTEMPGSATAAHTIGLNPSVELAASQFTLSVLTGVQLAIGSSGLDAWFRYAIVGGVWLHKRFALQLDGRARVKMTGDDHPYYGTFGFSGLINIHKYWNLELGMTTPLGDNANQSSMQFYLTISCGRWGTLTGKMKPAKEK